MTGFYRGGSFDRSDHIETRDFQSELRTSGYLTTYIRSGADMPISSRVRWNTIWADSTNFNLAAVMALSSSLEETTRQFS